MRIHLIFYALSFDTTRFLLSAVNVVIFTTRSDIFIRSSALTNKV